MWSNTCLHALDTKTDEFAALELFVCSVSVVHFQLEVQMCILFYVFCSE